MQLSAELQDVRKIRNLRWSMAIIFLLNVFDAFSTYIGVEKGYIQEGNPLMVEIVSDPLKLFLVKGVAVLVVLMLLLQLCREPRAYRLLQKGMYVLLVAYTAISLMHIYGLARIFIESYG